MASETTQPPAGFERMRNVGWLGLALLLALVFVSISGVSSDAGDEFVRSSLTDWGSDHVGQSFPDYITGDECLFCHRRDVGSTWHDNAHQTTLRRATHDDPTVAALLNEHKGIAPPDFLLGSKRLTRFLGKSTAYGKLDLLDVILHPQQKDSHRTAATTDSPTYDTTAFSNRCAGCHTTAVDSRTASFSATSLDCFTCHGDVDLAHTKDTEHIFLSEVNRDPRKVVSTCGQCHLRGGQSRSTERPYPNTFVPGDNLFHDFDIDLSNEAIELLPVIEQHIYSNCRDVGTGRDVSVTCLSCHTVHEQSSKKHQLLDKSHHCNSCHDANMDLVDDLRTANLLENHNKTCDY